jgi:hypothetical protein
MLAFSALFAHGDPIKCIDFLIDPNKPLSVKLIIISGAIAFGLMAMYSKWRNSN